jgi:hypothetical protein
VPGRVGDIVTTGRLRRSFWRVADALDYFVTLARLRMLDALAGPLPETPADEERQRDRERIKKAFPESEPRAKPSPQSPIAAGHLRRSGGYRRLSMAI